MHALSIAYSRVSGNETTRKRGGEDALPLQWRFHGGKMAGAGCNHGFTSMAQSLRSWLVRNPAPMKALRDAPWQRDFRDRIASDVLCVENDKVARAAGAVVDEA